MGSGDDTADPLSSLSEFLGEQFDDVDSDSGRREILDKFVAFLKESEAISSSAFPYKDLGAFIEQILPGPTPSITLEAARLYLLLLEKISVAFNELTFSSCLHHASRILKECTKTRGGKNSKTTILTTSGSIQITDCVHFWSKLTALFTEKVLNPSDANVASFALRSFGELIRYGSQSPVLDVAVSGVSNLLTNSSNFATISLLYKVCIPIARLPLLSANRKALVTVILKAADSEQNLDLTSERRSSFVAPRPDDCDETDVVHDDKEKADEDKDAGEAPSPGELSTKARYPVLRFLELCCLNVAERADDRTSTAKLVHQVISRQSKIHITEFQHFLQRSSRSPRTTVRMLTIELAAFMVQDVHANTSVPVSTTGLLDILQSRSQDRMPSVRCKAMQLLTESLKSFPNEPRNSIKCELLKGIGSMLGRLRDEKARVRKSATEYLGYVCRADIAQCAHSSQPERDPQGDNELEVVSGETSDGLDLFRMFDLLRQRCRDASAMVRQTAAEELSESLLAAIQHLEGNHIQRCFSLWADGVLPQVQDSDQRCRDITVEKARMIAFSGLEGSQMDRGSNTVIHSLSFPNLFLSHIGGENQSAANYGRNVTMVLCKNGKLGPKVIDSLCRKVKKFGQLEQDSRVSCGAWIALDAIARSGKARDVKRKLGGELLEKELNSGNAHAFGISLQLTRSMDADNRSSVVDSVRQTLFPSQKTKLSSLGPQSIYAALEFLASLQSDAGEELLEQCESFMLDSGGDVPETVTSYVLEVVGSICAVFKLRKEPPDALLHFIEASASQVQTSSKIRALAISTLGKMCLCESSQDVPRKRTGAGFPPRKNRRIMSADRIGETLTRRFVALFVHELENATSSATRNNAVIVLCDLCRRYTAVVEPFVSRLAALLTDPSEFVRVQVISSLVSLLQEDYIKIRTGPLLYQIANCLLDSSETVRAIAEYAVLQVMVQKNASILASSFVELVFVLNACTACSTYNQFPSEMQAASRKTFENWDYDRRLVIYDVFLRGMSAEQRIRLPGRLRSDVLTLIVDEKLLVTDLSVSNALDDTINLLTVDQLCSFSRAKCSGDEENGSESVPNAEDSQSQSSAGGNVLIQKVQALELRESTIPVLLEVRKLLERLRSPILKSLMRTLCTLLRPHRNNLETMIGDPLVRAEVAHEIAKPLKERQQELRHRARQKKRGLTETRDGTENASQQETPMEETAVPSTPRASARKPPLERPSVPRSKRTMRKRRIAREEEENGEEDDDIQMASSCRRLSMMDRICESPKLVALVRRGSAASSARLGGPAGHDGKSLFATTMARIEGETKS